MKGFGKVLMLLAMLSANVVEAYTIHVETCVCNSAAEVVVPITLDSAAGLSFVSVRLAYDAQILTLGKVEAGSLVSALGDDFTVSSNEVGCVTVGLFGTSNVVEAAGSVALLHFKAHENTERLYSDLAIAEVQLGEAEGVKDVTVGNPVRIENGMVRIMPDDAAVARLENAQTVLAGTRLATLSLTEGDAISAEDGTDGVSVSGAVSSSATIPVTPPRQGWKSGEYRLLSTVTPGLSLSLSGLGDEDEGTVYEKTEGGLVVYMASVRVAATDLGDLTLARALNENLYWMTDGDARWQPCLGSDASHSILAEVQGLESNGCSRVWTYVYGEGTLTFDWAGNVGASCGRMEFSVDGVCREAVTGEQDWTTVSVKHGAGRHRLEWLFRKGEGDAESSGSHYARLDNVAWSPEDPESAVRTSATGGVRSVSFSWLKERQTYLEQAQGDYEAAALLTGRNGRPLWQSYVAGLEPEDEKSDFKACIEMVDGAPRITWEPDLGAARTYTTLGKKTLLENEWKPVTEANKGDFNFFKVQVDLK